MTQTFKAGDKVEHRTFGVGEVVYGPYKDVTREDNYLMVGGDGIHNRVISEALTFAPAFAIGDRVRANSGFDGKLVAGPFVDPTRDAPFWVLEGSDGKHRTRLQSALTKLPSESVLIGDRVRVVEDDENTRTGEFVGKVGVVKAHYGTDTRLPYLVEFGNGSGRHGDPVNGRWNVARVEKVGDVETYEYKGVVYELGVQYTDTDGDRWTFAQSGPSHSPRSTFDSYCSNRPLTDVVDAHGPLTKVGDEPTGPDTVTYAGVAYELGVKYIDKDGDAWTFAKRRDGEAYSIYGSYRSGETLQYVVDRYGPIRKRS